MAEQKAFQEWVILEILGHRRLAGLLTEQQIAGSGFLRIDIPATSRVGAWTDFYPPASCYAIHPVTEELARAVAESLQAAPVSRFELPQLPAAAGASRWRADAFEDEEQDEA